MNKVSVIIPFHKMENLEYLRLCLHSLTNQGVELQVIIVSSVNESIYEVVKGILGDIEFDILENLGAKTYAQKVNLGATHANGTHILIAQDDLIFSADAIKTMSDEIGQLNMMMNPASNCDNENQFFARFTVPLADGPFYIKNKHKMDEIRECIPFIMKKMPIAPIWQKVAFLNTYCTMMPMHIWAQLGGFDEGFRNCKEDIDLSIRATKLGMHMVINWNCFVFHFSGATADNTDLSEDNKISNAHFDKKYGSKESMLIFETPRMSLEPSPK